jgi:hypothetical protein
MFVETKFFHKAGEGSGGGGGSDPHNLGYYADLTALQTARPTGTDGDFAILGSTDTIWVWDSGTSAWKDTDTKGQVTSVNGQTGAVTVDALPSQTGNTGKFLTTDGTDASWATINALQNTATGTNSLTLLGTPNTSFQEAINIGDGSKVTNGRGVAIGHSAQVSGEYATAIGGWFAKAEGESSIAIGDPAQATTARAIAIGNNAKAQSLDSIAIGKSAVVSGFANNAIQLGPGTNSTANTISVGLSNANNYRLLNSDGTIPKERLTNVVTTPSTAPVLAVADWSSNTQTITVTGVTATNTVFVAPAPASAADYAAAGILCTAQGSGTLTFTCTTVPSNAITVNVVILG